MNIDKKEQKKNDTVKKERNFNIAENCKEI